VRRARLLSVLLVAVVVAAGAGWWVLRSGSSGEETAPASAVPEGPVDVTPRPLALIPPGTVIGDGPPEGWSHLVIRSHTRVADDSLDKVSDTFARLTALLFTAVVADVRGPADSPHGGPYRLERVATGVGVEIDGRFVIVTSQTQEELGADLGFLERTALASAEAQIAAARCAARTPTMAVLDFHGIRVIDGRHRDVITRYAVLVHPKTGRLESVLWQFRVPEEEGEPEPTAPLDPMAWLKPSAIDDCPLHIDRDEFMLGVPVKKGFAMQRRPGGERTLPFPEGLESAAVRRRLTPEMVRTLEAGLRELLWGLAEAKRHSRRKR